MKESTKFRIKTILILLSIFVIIMYMLTVFERRDNLEICNVDVVIKSVDKKK